MTRSTVLCRYRYDPLDRLASRTPLSESTARVFYQADRPTTEVQSGRQRSFVHHDRQPLAQQALVGKSVDTLLTAADQQHSVLSALSAGQQQAIAYSPHGHRAPLNHLPGFNGEQPDLVTGHYLLGNGHRAYNPVLMRFNSPDSLSPFGKGGLNAYAYCAGDPVNRSDPSGEYAFDPFISMAYSALGLGTAAVGVGMARTAVKKVWQGSMVKTFNLPGFPHPILYISPSKSGKTQAGIAVTALAAGALWTASVIVKNVDPESSTGSVLALAGLALGAPVLGFRLKVLYRSIRPKQALKAGPIAPPKPAPALPVTPSAAGRTDSESIRRQSSTLRRESDVQETRL